MSTHEMQSKRGSSINSVPPLADDSIVFTGYADRQLKRLDKNVVIEIVAESGEQSDKNGRRRLAAFGQPKGLCTEGVHIFVTDSQIGT